MTPRPIRILALLALPTLAAGADDPIRDMQRAYAANKDEKRPRAYHFGSQGPGDVFTNHGSHTNRLVPVYVFGKKADLGTVTGKNSLYRDRAKIEALYGFMPENTHNPEAEYADQSDLHRVQKEAVARGAKYMFTVWFDGMDWQTTQAAAIAKTGRVYTEGNGSGLNFLDERADGTAQFGFVVTSPTHEHHKADPDAQTVVIPPTSLGGGYDPRIAGPDPWTDGPLKASGYLKGQSATAAERAGVEAVGGVLHAYTDSSTSAGEYATGVKAFNSGVNVADDGRFVPTLYRRLQADGWKVGTVTSVPFDHASPAAMYAHNVDRDDYQDIARDMLGLRSIAQERGKEPGHPGLDVVIGTGFGRAQEAEALRKAQGRNGIGGPVHITEADKAAIDVKNGGKYVVVQTTANVDGGEALLAAARSVKEGQKLFGLFGTTTDHLPYRTADGRYDPVPGREKAAEVYTEADLSENPTLAEMTRAALAVLGPSGKPFALFVEAGDVDFALHDNNLDNAIGAVLSGEEAVRVVLDWVKANSDWDESVLIVTADHGHYLVIDDPEAIATAKVGGR